MGDHDHARNVPRGLLCDGCNTVLGLIFDNPETLRRAADYLEHWGSRADPVNAAPQEITAQ